MLHRLIRFVLRQRMLVIGGVLLLAVVGIRSFRALHVEAFPDVEDIKVQIISLWPGHAAEELERSVTLPIERQMNGTPNLTNLRSVSMFGLSVVTLVFEDGITDYFARQQALERLTAVTLPAGVNSGLASMSNSTGEIFRYTLRGRRSLTELKELEDWVVEPAFRTVPGIADVVSFGGQVKEYQVDLDPAKLQAYGLSLGQVEQGIAGANGNAGGGYIAHGYEKQVVRGIGLFRSVADIAHVMLTSHGGVPVRVGDVGAVRIGGAPREGMVAKDTADDVVEGIVLMRKGGDALEVLKGVRAKAQQLNQLILPRDVQLVPFYDRATLVNHTVDTVEENLAIGATLVLVILVIFLGDWRSALIVGAVIPLSLLCAFILMDWRGVSANLISLGAVDFGIIVDSAVVMVEAFMVRLALQPPTAESDRRATVAQTAELMGRPILFSKAIVITAFLPIFTFQRVEKRIFSPMAFTLSFALLGSLVLSMTLVPVLSSWFVKGQHGETPAVRWMRRVFVPALDWVLGHARQTLLTALALLLGALLVGSRLGTEFLPALDEGNIWLRVTMPVGISLEQAKLVERRIRSIVLLYPQVRQVLTQLGRPDDGTDSKGSNNLEVYVDLKPRTQWGDVHDKDDLINRMYARMSQIPGLKFNFSQYIKDNVEEALSGVTGELVVKIFGPDLEVLQEKAAEVERVMAGVRGVADLDVERQFGQPQLRFEIDRDAIARYGLAVADVNDAIETAVGGKAVTQFLEGDRVFGVRVRDVAPARDSRRALEELPVNTPDGRIVPLGSLVRTTSVEGASRISREANERRIAIKCSVRGRDQGGFVAEAQRAVDRNVRLPPGYRLTWGGQFENQRRAMTRLAIIVPTSIVIIFILLFAAFDSTKYAALILANLPFALIGGILSLWLRSINLSVSAAVGFIALFGISVQNGVILASRFNELRQAGRSIEDAVRAGTHERLRPVVMTALMAALGLLPAALSQGVGAETTRPFATVIVGGLATATPLTLLLLPVLYRLFHEEPEGAGLGVSSSS
ncbi:MAG TPA: CusA/CzcA family heavy metal efflux RND transporter [Gemmatimonadales bacterium]|nr:CusA/CzcA family heavy metal efflux RND transporter [Gemmatimonadales bacterium]